MTAVVAGAEDDEERSGYPKCKLASTCYERPGRRSGRGFAQAVYELSITEGDRLSIVLGGDPGGWSVALNAAGARDLVPATFVGHRQRLSSGALRTGSADPSWRTPSSGPVDGAGSAPGSPLA